VMLIMLLYNDAMTCGYRKFVCESVNPRSKEDGS
jgi:hypothetical protein